MALSWLLTNVIVLSPGLAAAGRYQFSSNEAQAALGVSAAAARVALKPRGTLLVSTPEATAVDLVGYQHRAGGLDQVAPVLPHAAV